MPSRECQHLLFKISSKCPQKIVTWKHVQKRMQGIIVLNVPSAVLSWLQNRKEMMQVDNSSFPQWSPLLTCSKCQCVSYNDINVTVLNTFSYIYFNIMLLSARKSFMWGIKPMAFTLMKKFKIPQKKNVLLNSQGFLDLKV